MNIGLFQHLKPGWKVDLADKENVLKIYDGHKTSYFAAFGPKIDQFGEHELESLSVTQAESYSFTPLATVGPEGPDYCTLVLISLQEGDNIDVETLELIELHAATCVVNAPVRGHEMILFHILRHHDEEFKILALIVPKKRR
jgi:hypothetical protein